MEQVNQPVPMELRSNLFVLRAALDKNKTNTKKHNVHNIKRLICVCLNMYSAKSRIPQVFARYVLTFAGKHTSPSQLHLTDKTLEEQKPDGSTETKNQSNRLTV